MTGRERIAAAFEGMRTDGRIGLMTHAVCGYPDLSTSREILRAMVRSGADLLEVQIPFSDPSADGPLIVKANHAALAGGVSTVSCLDMLARLREETELPILVMSYLNPVLAFGPRRLAAFMAERGLDGLIVPDCPDDEPEYRLPGIAGEAGLAFVPLVAPGTSPERARFLADRTPSPFVYAVLRAGVTGRNTVVTPEGARRLAELRRVTGRFVAAGFGIGTRSQVESLAGFADCAIVGSAGIAAFDRGESSGAGGGVRAVAGLVSELRVPGGAASANQGRPAPE